MRQKVEQLSLELAAAWTLFQRLYHEPVELDTDRSMTHQYSSSCGWCFAQSRYCLHAWLNCSAWYIYTANLAYDAVCRLAA